VRTVELDIEDIAFGGKGVARENGKAVFVPFVIEGEKISAQIVREKKQFAEAEKMFRGLLQRVSGNARVPALVNLANVCGEQGKLEEAEKLLRHRH